MAETVGKVLRLLDDSGTTQSVTYYDDDDGLTSGDIAGIVIGVFVGIVLIAVLVYYCCVRQAQAEDSREKPVNISLGNMETGQKTEQPSYTKLNQNTLPTTTTNHPEASRNAKANQNTLPTAVEYDSKTSRNVNTLPDEPTSAPEHGIVLGERKK